MSGLDALADAATTAKALRAQDALVLEKTLQREVLKLARLTGWLCYHTFDSRKSQAGFPDLVLVRPPRIVFAELKRQTGPVSVGQADWLDRIARCHGAESYLWRPSDWREGAVERVLV